MKKEGSKREHGPNFCFDFWVRFGHHRALYHISIVIIPTLVEGFSAIRVEKMQDQLNFKQPLSSGAILN